MKSWKSRLLMAFTMLAVVLVLTLPAMAEDIDIKVECEAERGHCQKQVSHEVWQEDTGSEPEQDLSAPPAPQQDLLAPPADVVSADKAPVDEMSDKECSERPFPPCGYWWPYGTGA